MTPRTDDYATVFVATCDLAGQVRGRAVPPSEHDAVAAQRHRLGSREPRDLLVRPDRPRQRLRLPGRPAAGPRRRHRGRHPGGRHRPGDAALPRRPDAAGRTALGLLPAHLPAGRPRGAARTHRHGGRRRLRARIRARRPAGERLRSRSGASGRPNPSDPIWYGCWSTPASNRRHGFPSTATASSRSPSAPPLPRSRPTGPSSSGNSSATWPAAVACPSPSPRSWTPTVWATASTSI